MLDDEISSLSFFSWGRFNDMQRADSLFRTSVFFSYIRIPSYRLYTEGIDGSMVNLKGEGPGKNGRRSGKFMSKLLKIISSGEMSIMDLKCAVLYSEHRRFLVPYAPLNFINSYIGDNLTGDFVNLNPFILKGTFLMISVAPYRR